jgi:tetratricopeptide (TPR) repeat protein
MAEIDSLPFSERSFVSEIIPDSEKMSTYPDNRSKPPRIYVTNALNITKEEINSAYSQLYTPWKPEQPIYTVRDWRRSVKFSQLPKSPPTVPSVSEMMKSSQVELPSESSNTPRSSASPRNFNINPSSGNMVKVAENKKKRQTPYLSRAPRLVNNNKRSYNSKKTQKSPRSPRRSNRFNNSPRNKHSKHSLISPSSSLTDKNSSDTPETEKHEHQNKSPSIEQLEMKSRQYLLNHKYLQAVQCQRRAIAKVKKLFGLSSQKIRGCCEKYVVMCNSTAMKMLDLKNYQLSLELLERASDITQRSGPLQRHNESRLKLRTTTMNNLGCYWKNKREYGRALNFLQKAASLETKIVSKTATCDSPATTHLNICSVLSALGRHAQAHDHACAALQVLNIEMDRAIQGGGDIAEAEKRSIKLRITAFYNKAVEEMWLFQYSRAKQTFMEGLDEFDEDDQNNIHGTNALRIALEEGLKEANFQIDYKLNEKIRMDKMKEDKLKFRQRNRK